MPRPKSDVLIYNIDPSGLDEASVKAARECVRGPLWENVPAVYSDEAHETGPNHRRIFGGLAKG